MDKNETARKIIGDYNTVLEKKLKEKAENKALEKQKNQEELLKEKERGDRENRIATAVDAVYNVIGQLALAVYHFTFTESEQIELTDKVTRLILDTCADKTHARLKRFKPDKLMTIEERIKESKL